MKEKKRNNEINNEINIDNQNKELERVNFGKEIVKNYLPKKINDKLKTEREQRIKELNGKNNQKNQKQK